MSDSFSFQVSYTCMTCADCPDFYEHTGEFTVTRSCLHLKGPRKETFVGVWATDEIHPDCPHRKEQKNVQAT